MTQPPLLFNTINTRLVEEQQTTHPIHRILPSTPEIQNKRQNPSYLTILLTKNLTLMLKNPKNLIFLILTPFLLSLLLWSFQKLANDKASRSIIDPPFIPTIDFPHCEGRDCVSLVYMNINMNGGAQPDWITHTIKYIQNKTGFDQTQIKKLSDIKTLEDWTNFKNDLSRRPNKTQIGVMFCAQSDFSLQDICNTDPDYYSYFLILNKTDSFSVVFTDPSIPLPKDPLALSLKLLIDNAIVDFQVNKNFSQKLIYNSQQYPFVPSRFVTNFDIITQTGAFYYMITPLFAFLFIQNQIVREKQYKLRQGLNVFGAPHWAYWLSWFVVSIIYSLISAISTLVAGLSFQFLFFKDTPFMMIILIMFPFTLAMQMVSYFISTLAPNLKAANSISYGLVLFAIVVQSFTTNNSLLDFIFQDQASGLVIFLRYFLTLYPPFSYTKVFVSITQKSGYHFNMITTKWQRGQGYSWADFMHEEKGKTLTKSPFTQYSSFNSMWVLYGTVVFYAVLTWYFDHVVESNRGKGYSPIFFLTPSYWGWKNKTKKSQKQLLDDLRNPSFSIRSQQQSVTKERLRVNKNISTSSPALGMRIKNLSKTFTTMCSKNKVEAIKNITLEIKPNQLMSFLGHNGAGKTTFINIMTGILSPDANNQMEIVINNNSIDNIAEIRKYIGVCPQFDILWKEMTAEQHLRMFGKLKGIPNDMLEVKIDEVLTFVNLLSQKKNIVNSFSGGMKRRLSLAVAAIGNPKIIFLDEPTTGLDPKVRQQVWKLIQKLKKNKSVVLTTHSMEQADILSDRISIMVKGRLKCIGSSIYLKQNYGSGYRIALNVVSQKVGEVLRYIRKLFPDAVEVDCNGGNIIIGIMQENSLVSFIKMLENKQSGSLDEYSLKQLIKDWNVSHTTLEEVFMKVTKEDRNLDS